MSIQSFYGSREPVKHSVKGDPVEQWADGKWYFWEETWAVARGPFETRDEAVAACSAYAETP